MEEKVYWVNLRGEDQLHMEEMAKLERRPYSSVMRVALDHYYRTRFSPTYLGGDGVDEEISA